MENGTFSYVEEFSGASVRAHEGDEGGRSRIIWNHQIPMEMACLQVKQHLKTAAVKNKALTRGRS